MKLVELFHSFSGEAPTVGTWSTFIRFPYCNMDKLGGKYCRYCDTSFALYKKNYADFSVEQITNEIIKAKTSLVVFTGGEPTLHQSSIKKICDSLYEKGNLSDLFVDFQIETNGGLPLDMNKCMDIKYVVVSPKFPPSIRHEYELKIFETKINVFDLGKWFVMKFVWESEESEKWIMEYIKKYSIPNDSVWIMPEGTFHRDLLEKAPKVMDFCKKNGFNFSERLQITYFGNRRGV